MRGVIWWCGIIIITLTGALGTQVGTTGGVVWTVALAWWTFLGFVLIVRWTAERAKARPVATGDPAVSAAVEEVIRRARARSQAKAGGV
jgi:hypothetical protein